MFVQSNDLFYSVPPWGIPLFTPDGDPREFDLTPELRLYDAGTELNEQPGAGPNQAPRQAAPGAGQPDPNPVVRLAEDEFGNLPNTQEVISADLSYDGDGLFRLTIANVSNSTTLRSALGFAAVPLSPVAWVVHRDSTPFFQTGDADLGEGLEDLAEDGNARILADHLAPDTGVTSPISPGAYAVHTETGVFFDFASADRDQGLESLAEDGSPRQLVESLNVRTGVSSAGMFNKVLGSASPGPAFPGESYEFTIAAGPGDRLSLASMYIESNDLFVAFGDVGVELFSGETPISGDVSNRLQLWDAGTEVNEISGAGPTQAPRQPAPNIGIEEAGIVRLADDFSGHPRAPDIVRVVITPQ
jgi:hypothetical protein